jgi:NodT family efflux transporter outer membrane factor (OMF) lipoprotein
MRRLTILTALVTASGLAACSVHSVNDRPTAPVEVPAGFGEHPAGEALTGPWWREFGDPELSALIERSLRDNLELRAVWARLSQARAISGQAGAGRWPQVEAEAGVGRGRDLTGATHNNFSWSVAAGYELDLWRRVASQTSAARNDVQAARDDVEATATSLAAAVAESWYDLVYRRAQSELIAEQMRTNEIFLELVRLRFGQGLVSALDVHQQRQRVFEVEAELAAVEAGQRVAEHRLAVLLGKAPRTIEPGRAAALPDLPPFPDTGVPADLLTRRPDARAAQRRVVAADYRVAAAIADRLPAIRLTASAGKQTDSPSDLIENPLWNLASGLLAPVFDGGRRKQEAARNRAVVEERLAQLGSVLLRALREVEDAIVLERQQLRVIAELTRALEESRSSLEEARDRYQQGLTEYLQVLTALGATQALELRLLGAQRQLVSHRIQLYRALGGAWTRGLSRPKKTEKS